MRLFAVSLGLLEVAASVRAIEAARCEPCDGRGRATREESTASRQRPEEHELRDGRGERLRSHDLFGYSQFQVGDTAALHLQCWLLAVQL